MEQFKDLCKLCKASVDLSYRRYADYYQTLKDNLGDGCMYVQADDFLTPEDMQKCLETDIYWELQFYPDTPVGSYKLIGSDPEALIEAAIEIIINDRTAA